MKKMRIIYTMIALMAANWASAQNFEGVINMSTANEEMKETATLTWYLKGDRSRMDIVSKAGDHNSSYAIISDEKGMDMVAEGNVTNIPASAMKADMATLSLVSEMNAVSMNGYLCKQVVYSDGKYQTTYWLTDALNLKFDDIPMALRRNMPSISTTGFPVKMEKRDATGKVVLRQDVLSVKTSAVDDSKFERR
jgi:hypothetical protein